ncbi:hypothetical protein ACQKII_02420 [Lysinibacillus sp. NPDC048646]|uniref:hypothetical protein n=1 Tax=Lysinibacillus sp. NPDC048646 TaxID=3390574 RepID=UPI003D0824FC
MKKFVSTFLSLSLVFSSVGFSASASELDSNNEESLENTYQTYDEYSYVSGMEFIVENDDYLDLIEYYSYEGDPVIESRIPVFLAPLSVALIRTAQLMKQFTKHALDRGGDRDTGAKILWDEGTSTTLVMSNNAKLW